MNAKHGKSPDGRSNAPGEAPRVQWLTTREAAQRLSVSLRTVQLWVEAGVLAAAKTAGGHRRIPEEEVAALAARTGLGGVLPNAAHAAPAQPAPPLRGEDGTGAWDLLLVEDNPDQRNLWLKTLGIFGDTVHVRTAENGYEALIQIGQRTPHVLITDLMMPGIDGFEMLRTLERMPGMARIPVIVITAMPPSEITERGGLPEGVDVLNKPLSPAKLVSHVEQALTKLDSSRAPAA